MAPPHGTAPPHRNKTGRRLSVITDSCACGPPRTLLELEQPLPHSNHRCRIGDGRSDPWAMADGNPADRLSIGLDGAWRDCPCECDWPTLNCGPWPPRVAQLKAELAYVGEGCAAGRRMVLTGECDAPVARERGPWGTPGRLWWANTTATLTDAERSELPPYHKRLTIWAANVDDFGAARTALRCAKNAKLFFYWPPQC
eukprot:590353-Prymnesium_polylepis.1